MQHKFVEFIPSQMEQNILYVSMEYKTVAHLCACGCGNEVITPITPTDWKLTYDGKGISLYPSIGNWDFKCQSHYWIKNGNVSWASKWSKQQIKATQNNDKLNKKRYYKNTPNKIKESLTKEKKNIFIKFINFIFKR